MIYPDVFYKAWVDKYQLTLPKKICDHCLDWMKWRAFLMKGYAGVQAYCPCGKNKRSAMSMVTITDGEFKKWLDLVS